MVWNLFYILKLLVTVLSINYAFWTWPDWFQSYLIWYTWLQFWLVVIYKYIGITIKKVPSDLAVPSGSHRDTLKIFNKNLRSYRNHAFSSHVFFLSRNQVLCSFIFIKNTAGHEIVENRSMKVGSNVLLFATELISKMRVRGIRVQPYYTLHWPHMAQAFHTSES